MIDSTKRILNVNDAHVQFGAVRALRGVSFEVRTGEIVSILGANGAGKSTILRTISGLETLSAGSIEYNDETIATPEKSLAGPKIVRRGITQSPEGRRIFPECTVMENLEMGAYTINDRLQFSENLEKAFHYFPRLAERRKQMGATLSGGEQQMLGVARALMSNPRLLLLDEPSLGLAPLIVAQIFEIIQQINREDNVTILLVEQNAYEALQHSHRGYVLETGKIIHDGSAGELMKDERVIEAYLGL